MLKPLVRRASRLPTKGLLDHPTATRCYAWEVDGEVTAVLHAGPVDGPQAAVRAAIMAESEG